MPMLSYDKLKDKPTVLLSFTGLKQEEFTKLLGAFAYNWKKETRRRNQAKKNRQRKAGGGRKPSIAKMEDRLLFILFYLKTYPLQEVLAFHFDLSQGQANRMLHRSAKVVKAALGQLGELPEREGERLAEVLSEYETLTFTQDGSERRRQRPKKGQKAYYSGKKKCHTVKNHLVIHPESRRVSFLSKTVAGKMHDKKLADQSNLTFPNLAVVEQDTGFQGYELDNIIIVQPKKKPRKQELTTAELFINKAISSGRVIVENVIAGIKRCRIVKDVLRNWKSEFDDLVMEIACGLHNLRTTFRQPQHTFSLFELI